MAQSMLFVSITCEVELNMYSTVGCSSVNISWDKVVGSVVQITYDFIHRICFVVLSITKTLLHCCEIVYFSL